MPSKMQNTLLSRKRLKILWRGRLLNRIKIFYLNSETGRVSLFRISIYHVSVSTGLNLSSRWLVPTVIDYGPDRRVTETAVLNPSWLENITRRDMPEIRISFSTRWPCSESITPYLWTCKFHTRITFGIEGMLAGKVLWRTTFVGDLERWSTQLEGEKFRTSPPQHPTQWHATARVQPRTVYQTFVRNKMTRHFCHTPWQKT